jgi:outer membrane protein OmpA-like peptidoglycan-associated protein
MALVTSCKLPGSIRDLAIFSRTRVSEDSAIAGCCVVKNQKSAVVAICFLLACLGGCASKESSDTTPKPQTSTAAGNGPALTTTPSQLTTTASAESTTAPSTTETVSPFADSAGTSTAATTTAEAETSTAAPTSTTSAEVSSPAASDGKPVELAGKPVDLVGKPAELVGKPGDLYGKPSNLRGKPVELTGKPVELTGKPVELTGKPVELTGKPVELVGKPVELVGKPVELVGKPVELTGKPVELTGKPVALTGNAVDLTVKETPQEIRIDMATDVLFDFDKSTLLPKARQTLHKAAGIIRDKAKGAVRIEGYTDGKGSDAYNQKLSERRANAVRDWFAKNEELSAVQFDTQGFGAKNPVAPNKKPDGSDNPAGRQKNRRVTIVIVK